MNDNLETALRKAFGERDTLHAVMCCALRRAAGGLVSLTQMADGALWLCITPPGTAAPGTALLVIPAPREGADEEALALRIAVIDWRSVARQYDALNAM